MTANNTSSPTQLTTLIKEKALALGFARVGIIPAAPLTETERQPLQQWLGLGYQADMQWMVNHLEKRLDPGSLMEGTRSIVCVAMNYYNPDPDPAPTRAAEIKIAKYARGTDYHYVVKDRLKELLTYIQGLSPAAQGRALTDSAPIMEKPLAIKAGLGWLGKNGNLITPGLGSWVFLGELLLNIPLDYDAQPIGNHCGTCTRCIDACPTDAIIPAAHATQRRNHGNSPDSASMIDANRCISYWTIENKGDSFPNDIREQLGGWIFGCDICQDVCPWNIKFARPTTEPAFQPRPLNEKPDAMALLSLDEETFREQYRKSPVKRTKLSGLHRNIRQALNAGKEPLQD